MCCGASAGASRAHARAHLTHPPPASNREPRARERRCAIWPDRRTVTSGRWRTQRAALADDLADLSAEQWRHWTLCGEWDVEEIVAHLIAAASLNQWRWARSMFGARFRVDVHNQRRMVEQRGSTPAETPDRFRAIPPGCHRQHHRSLGTLRPTSVRPSYTPRTSAFLWDCPGQRVAGSGRIERVVHLVLGTGHQHGPPRAVCRPTRRPRRRHTAKARPRRRSVNRCCVEVKGLEPSTYGLQSRRSSS